MKFNENSTEKYIPNEAPEARLVNKLELLAGTGLRVRLTKENVNLTSGNLTDGLLEGTLDIGVKLGQPLSLNNGRIRTMNLLNIVESNAKLFLVTENAVYKLTVGDKFDS